MFADGPELQSHVIVTPQCLKSQTDEGLLDRPSAEPRSCRKWASWYLSYQQYGISTMGEKRQKRLTYAKNSNFPYGSPAPKKRVYSRWCVVSDPSIGPEFLDYCKAYVRMANICRLRCRHSGIIRRSKSNDLHTTRYWERTDLVFSLVS
jgi:hypothetical protein